MAFDPITGNLLDADFIPADPTSFVPPKNAILSANGDSVLVADQIDDVVQEYGLDGNYLGVFAPAGGANTAILNNIRGIDLDANGNLLVTSAGAHQRRRSPSSTPTATTWATSSPSDPAAWTPPSTSIRERRTGWSPASTPTTCCATTSLAPRWASLLPVNNFPPASQEAGNSNVLVANFGGTQQGVVEFTRLPATLVGVYTAATWAAIAVSTSCPTAIS